MQYLIRIISDESEDFRRDILIDEDATFLDLNNVILQSCGYPDDQMTSFYICNDEWERGEQVTREDVRDSAEDQDIFTMADTQLTEFLDNGVTHLEFCFDPFSDRVFSLVVRDERSGSGDPEVVKSVGDAPQQIKDLDLSDLVIAAGGNGSDFAEDFGIESFNSDEIDLEGFEISDDTQF